MTHFLRSYIRDHHAGSTAGTALAWRMASQNASNSFGPPLHQLAKEVQEDKEVLERVMSGLGIERSKVKDGAMRLAERASLLKRNGTLTSYNPLSRLLEIEGLNIGITGKLAMWEAFALAITEPPEDIDFTVYADRARDQLERLQELHREAIRAAFAPNP